MTTLTYFIKCKNGSLLKDEKTEEPVQVSTWALAKGYARMVKGEVVPHYEEKVTY